MTHGHPEYVDDAILESGNRNAKIGKRNLFWGGTSEEGAVYTMQRNTNKRGADGELITKTVTSCANASVEQQHLENTFLRQLFQMRRDVKKSAACSARDGARQV